MATAPNLSPEALNLDNVLDTLPDTEHLKRAGIEIEPVGGHKVPIKVVPFPKQGSDQYEVVEEIPIRPIEYTEHFPGQAALASSVFNIEPAGPRVPAIMELASKVDSAQTQAEAVALIKGAIDFLTIEEIDKILDKLPQAEVVNPTESKVEVSDDDLIQKAQEAFRGGNGDLLETLEILDKVSDVKKRDDELKEVSIQLGQLDLFNEARRVAEKVTDVQLKEDLLDVINRLDQATPEEIEAHTESSSEVIKQRISLALDYVRTLPMGDRMLAISNLIRDLENANSLDYAREVVEYAPRLTPEERNKILEILDTGEVTVSDTVGDVRDSLKEEEEGTEDDSTAMPSSAPVIPITTGMSEAEVLALSKSPEELREEINRELSAARSEYAAQLTEFRNKKGKLDKLRAQLGVSKQTPESEWPEELKQAEKRYLEAKKKKREGVIGKDKLFGYKNERTGEVTKQFVFNEDIVKEAEEEYAALQGELADLTPEKQKGMMSKALQKWTSLSPAKRIAVSTAIMTAGGLAAGTFGLVGAAGYAGYRVARFGAGTLTGQGAGKFMDWYQAGRNNKLKHEATEKYGTQINLENFEEKERELMRQLEELDNIKKRQRLYKAGVMLTAGLATYGVSGKTVEHFAPGIKTSTGLLGAAKHSFVGDRLTDKELMHPHVGHNLEAGHTISPDAEKLFEKDAYKVNAGLAEKLHIPEPEPAPVNIEISSHGFIGTFNDLKKKLLEQYGEGKVPKEYEHFVNTPSEKLAQEFGFYKPGEHMQSGMAFKGETLDLNAKGQLEYHQLDGHTAVIDTDHKFNGKMFDAEAKPAAPVAAVADDSYDGPKTQSGYEDMNMHEAAEPDVQDNPKFAYDADQTEPEHLYSKSDAALESQSAVDTPVPVPAMHAPEPVIPPHPGEALLNHPRAPLTMTQIEVGDKVGYIETTPAGKVLELRGVGQIAHEHTLGTGSTKVFALDDKFQEGEKFADVRKTFTVLNEKLVQPEKIGKMVYPLNFEGGKITLVHGDIGGYPDSVHVLLNGKEIATGTVDEIGTKVQYLGPKSGLLLPDNAYERAFKHVQPLLKTLRHQAFDNRMAQFTKDAAMAKTK